MTIAGKFTVFNTLYKSCKYDFMNFEDIWFGCGKSCKAEYFPLRAEFIRRALLTFSRILYRKNRALIAFTPKILRYNLFYVIIVDNSKKKSHNNIYKMP